MTQEEALRMALEALEADELDMVDDGSGNMVFRKEQAITAIKEALAQPEQIMQDSTCSTTLRLQGKPYPRTCKKCGLGPCIAQPSAQPEQEPVAWEQFYPDIGKPQIAINSEIVGYVAPQRTWVGLTNNELQPIADEYRILFGGWVEDFARAIEAKLKDKNTRGKE